MHGTGLRKSEFLPDVEVERGPAQAELDQEELDQAELDHAELDGVEEDG
jgi:hypothetical protein